MSPFVREQEFFSPRYVSRSGIAGMHVFNYVKYCQNLYSHQQCFKVLDT